MNPKRVINKAPDFDETWEAARGYFTNSQFHHRSARDCLEDTSSIKNKLMERWFGKDPQDP